MRILIVEDEPAQARLLETRLQDDTGWSVIVAGTVKEARDAASDHDGYDAAVVDYMLPDGTGLDVLDALHDADPSLPVIFLTGQGNEEVAWKAMSQGAMDYLVKGSTDEGDVVARIRAVVEEWRGVDPVQVQRTEGSGGDKGDRSKRTPGAVTLAMREAADDALEEALGSASGKDVKGAAVFTGRGEPVTARLPDDVDMAALGDVALQVTRNIGALGRVGGVRPRGHVLVIDGGSAKLATSIVPGPWIVVLFLDPEVKRDVAVQRLMTLARRVWEGAGH